ncbi:MAG: SWIM zinc finger family protein [Ruminococcus sp.]|nr:SWIM zinc finger family protein [Ruminococcus sp.]
MNLKNFEEYFDRAILQRGKNYYKNGAVLSIEKISENEYTAEVDGSELYDVTVEMDDHGNIYDVSCDCPYDMGAYCKHEAAVLYALREINIKITQPSAKKLNLPQLLGKCSTAQLAEIILEHAKEDKGFGNYLRMRLSETSDTSSIISDFKRISDAYFRGRSDIDDVLKAGRLLIDKTKKLSSAVDKIQIYAEIIFMLENDIEDACNNGYDEESWELFETISDCSYYYEYIISYENMSDRIYQFCCEYSIKISYYYEKLKTTEFKEQSKNLYEKYIRNEGNRASTCSEYAILCEKLKKFSKECGTELTVKVVADFRELYRRKPAFMDELTKAGF